jgi:preprotein translocase subunit SecA
LATRLETPPPHVSPTNGLQRLIFAEELVSHLSVPSGPVQDSRAKRWLDRLRGSTVSFDTSRFTPDLAVIGAAEDALRRLSDDELLAKGRTLRDRARRGEPLPGLRNELFALAREAARRTLGLRPFDEQILAGLAMDEGRVVEMATGEGKTLAAVLPAALHGLTGTGVHVLTFNDYLAIRDAEWMRPVYRAIGLDVAAVDHHSARATRQAAYRADVTYVTAKEAGFDHLRDLLADHHDQVTHRPFHFALVDEADSLLVDEARVPLVLAGRMGEGTSRAGELAAVVATLSPGVDFCTDEYARDVELTDPGIERVERAIGCANLHAADELPLLAAVNCALHARALLRRDVDYIVREGRVEIVDEFTGRVLADRHWPDGLQAALEAKEGLARAGDGEILASMTLQRFLRHYPRLCGMTGTARNCAHELLTFYGLGVTVVPTHRPTIRVDASDIVFATRAAKERAVVEEARRAHAAGRPVLVGTTTVVESERLAAQLRRCGVDCAVLNAKNDEEEAAVVSRAGTVGAVTISTNMAGRGTDIRLGGPHEEDRARVVALGGLYVIGTNRHESLRVDLQLRGRAGRQGDPGESRFFVSLQDDLLVRYGVAGLLAGRWAPSRQDAPVDHPVVRREVERVQRIVEGQHFEMRRTLARYTSVVDRQHDILFGRRESIRSDRSPLTVWQEQAATRRAELVAAAGSDEVDAAEREVTLRCLDREWRAHLAFCADLREGIHLVRLGGKDPLTHFTSEAIGSFESIDERIDEAVTETIDHVEARNGRIDLSAAGLAAPSSTWTYLVNDDPFEQRIGSLLTGPGGSTVAVYAALHLAPLLVLWGAVDRLFRRKRPAGPASLSNDSPPDVN